MIGELAPLFATLTVSIAPVGALEDIGLCADEDPIIEVAGYIKEHADKAGRWLSNFSVVDLETNWV